MDAGVPERRSHWKVNLVFGFIFGVILIVFLKPELLRDLSFPDLSGLNTFKTMFVSIVLEALPFILLSVIVSSLMHVFLPEGWIRKVIPRNPLLGVAVACLLGIVFPICECGLIPIVRRLIAKGMPLYVGIVFILVGPIVNPIVYSATYAAFRTRPEMLIGRMGLALAVGLVVGLFIHFVIKGEQLKSGPPAMSSAVPGAANRHRRHDHHHDHNNDHDHRHDHHHDHGHHHDDNAHNHRGHDHHGHDGHRSRNKLFAVLNHAGGELFDMGGYLIFGALIAAGVQAFLPRADLAGIGQSGAGSHLFMMGFAFVLSLCSTSDAFVASSFVSTFSAGSLIAFLVFGPMMNMKGILMLLTAFKSRFVILILLLVGITVFAGSMLFARIYGLY